MTTVIRALSEPLIWSPELDLSLDDEVVGCLGRRGYSDSVVPTCLTTCSGTMDETSDIMLPRTVNGADPPREDDITKTKPPPTLLRGSKRVKAYQNLQLPSFRSLGISNTVPGALPTPPDEVPPPSLSTSWTSLGAPPRSQSVSEGMLISTSTALDPQLPPTTTVMSDPSSSAGHAVGASNTPQQGSSTISTPQISQNIADDEEDSGSDTETFISLAVSLAANNIPKNTQQNTPQSINVFRASQPCPLPNEDGSATSFYDPLMAKLETDLGPDESIDVTTAVPPQFEPGQILSSPALTPTARNANSDDYFGLQVFPRIVLALDHQTSIAQGLPPSPRPAVPPASINVSVLERYIPPPSTHEYMDLFKTNTHSVLVDRLFELSPNNGTLLFIYPTAKGATDFTSHHLQPLLDPLLRSMINIHGLSADFGPSIATMPAAHGLYDYEALQQNVTSLLAKLSKPRQVTFANPATSAAPESPTVASGSVSPTTSSKRNPPTLSLVHSTKANMPLDRSTWIKWWMHQEKPRIRNTVDRYYQRGKRVPDERVLSPGTFTWMILDGLQQRAKAFESTAFGEGGEEDGVEVGVFVIARSG